MSDTTHSPASSHGIFAGFARALRAIGQTLVDLPLYSERVARLEALSRESDADLAARGTDRQRELHNIFGVAYWS